jgi:cell division protein ZapA
MAEVAITLNGRTYRLECGDGEEEHLLALSELVGKRLNTLQKQFGQVGDDRLLLMTALMIADELDEAQKKLAEAEADQASADDLKKSEASQVADQISAAADRIEVLSAALDDGQQADKSE